MKYLSHDRFRLSGPSLVATRALACAVLIGLSACASGPSKKDCEEADVYAMGVKDGNGGDNTERYDHYKAACGSQGVTLNQERYDYGRKVGLVDYCSEKRAKSDARDHKADSICMKENVPPYQAAYAKEADAQRKDKEKELGKIQKDQEKLKQKQDEVQGQLNQIPASPR